MKGTLPLAGQRYGTEPGNVRRKLQSALRTERLAVGVTLAVLIFAVATDRFGILTPSMNFRSELLAAGVLGLWCLVRFGLVALRTMGRIEVLLGAWLAIGSITSLIFAPSPLDSAKYGILITGLLVLYAVGLTLLRSKEALTWAAVLWVATGSFVMIVGLVSALLYIMTGWTEGVSFNRLYQNGILSATPMVYSTLWEANIFGSYSLTVGVLAFALSRAPGFRSPRQQWLLRGAMALAFSGAVLSMTRTVWAAGALLVLGLLLVCLRVRVLTIREVPAALAGPVIAGVIVGLLIGYSMPSISIKTDDPWNYSYQQVLKISGDAVTTPGQVVQVQATPTMGATSPKGETTAVPERLVSASKDSAFIDRLFEVLSFKGVPTFVARQKAVANALAGWTERPILGWGFGTYPQVFPPAPGEPDWIANLELHLLFDTGLAGLLLFGTAMVLAARQGLRALKGPATAWDNTHYILFGLLAACAGLLFAYQLTEATWLGFTWVILAMLVAGGRLVASGRESLNTGN